MCTVLLPPGDNPIAVNKYININIKGHAMGPANSGHLLTAETGVRTRSSPSEIYREQSETATGFCLSNLGFYCQYHFTDPPDIFSLSY